MRPGRSPMPSEFESANERGYTWYTTPRCHQSVPNVAPWTDDGDSAAAAFFCFADPPGAFGMLETVLLCIRAAGAASDASAYDIAPLADREHLPILVGDGQRTRGEAHAARDRPTCLTPSDSGSSALARWHRPFTCPYSKDCPTISGSRRSPTCRR